jgi:dodecin
MHDEHVYKRIDLVGSSSVSTDDAIRNAVARASETVKNLEWFEVDQVRGHIRDGKVAHFQVMLRVGFRLDRS